MLRNAKQILETVPPAILVCICIGEVAISKMRNFQIPCFRIRDNFHLPPYPLTPNPYPYPLPPSTFFFFDSFGEGKFYI